MSLGKTKSASTEKSCFFLSDVAKLGVEDSCNFESEGEQETTGGKCPPSMSTVQNGFSMFRCVSTETRRTTSKGNNCNNLKQGDEVSSTCEAQHPSYEKYTGQKREHSNMEFLRSTSCTNALANSPQKVHSSSQKILFSSENFLDNAENRIKKGLVLANCDLKLIRRLNGSVLQIPKMHSTSVQEQLSTESVRTCSKSLCDLRRQKANATTPRNEADKECIENQKDGELQCKYFEQTTAIPKLFNSQTMPLNNTTTDVLPVGKEKEKDPVFLRCKRSKLSLTDNSSGNEEEMMKNQLECKAKHPCYDSKLRKGSFQNLCKLPELASNCSCKLNECSCTL